MNVCPFNWRTSSQRETVDDHISRAVNTRFVAPSKHVIITMTNIIALVALNLHLGSRGAVNALMNVFRKRRERVPKRLDIYTFFWWAEWVPHGVSLVFKYKTNFDETFELYSRRQFISQTVLHVFDFRHRNPQSDLFVAARRRFGADTVKHYYLNCWIFFITACHSVAQCSWHSWPDNVDTIVCQTCAILCRSILITILIISMFQH